MDHETTADSATLAELLLHVARASQGEEPGGAQLTAAQWTALRFFARANRASRTPSAFAMSSAVSWHVSFSTIVACLFQNNS